MKTLKLMLQDGGWEDALGWLLFMIGVASCYLLVYALS